MATIPGLEGGWARLLEPRRRGRRRRSTGTRREPSFPAGDLFQKQPHRFLGRRAVGLEEPLQLAIGVKNFHDWTNSQGGFSARKEEGLRDARVIRQQQEIKRGKED
jgi:hypothetical protein